MSCPIPVMNKEIHKDKCVWVKVYHEEEGEGYNTECNRFFTGFGRDVLKFEASNKCHCGKPIHILEDK